MKTSNAVHGEDRGRETDKSYVLGGNVRGLMVESGFK